MYASTTRYVPVPREVRPTARKAVANSEIAASLGFVAIQLLAVAVIGLLLLTGPAAQGPLR